MVQGYCQPQEEQAFKFLNDTLRKDPRNSELLFMRGLAFSEIKKYDKAIADFTAALNNLKPHNSNTTFGDKKPADSADILMIRAYCYDVTKMGQWWKEK